jgi:kynureninase
VPFSLRERGLGDAYAVGGGYKYLQLGEGNCFLRLPPGCSLRPAITGWFAEFGERAADPGGAGRVSYAAGPARFAGGTYDPVSHYRAAEVFDFFAEMGLAPAILRAVSRHQVGLLAQRVAALDLDPKLLEPATDVALEQLGGFLALRSSRATELSEALAAAGVATDARGSMLRLGPAPYLSDGQLRAAVAIIGDVAARPGTAGSHRR